MSNPNPGRFASKPGLDGFDWGPAIGAGSAAAIILLVSAGGIIYRHRHEHLEVTR